jgi:SAM-dependent methyltransferase
MAGSSAYVSTAEVRDSYTAMAAAYADAVYGELAGKPFDRRWLDRLAAQAGRPGPICDLGCGPGQIARYLHDRGAAALGVDLSPGMVALARQLNPDIPFHTGDMLALPFPRESWGGIAAFYSLIHQPRERATAALTEMGRVLRPGGLLLLAVHEGDEVLRVNEEFGVPVRLDFTFFRRTELEAYARAAGLAVIESVVREPYGPDVEYQSRRVYLLAAKPPS